FSEDDGRAIAEGARLFAGRRRHEKFGAVGGFIANVLRTTRSALKQAFSSWNVSISHGHFEFCRAARVATQFDLRIFCVTQTRCRFARGTDRGSDRRHDLRIEFRRESCADLCVWRAVVQSLAGFAGSESCLFGVLALALS